MTLNHDVYSFDLLKNGTEIGEFTRNSSMKHLQDLLNNELITVEEGKIFLTEKGEAAKRFGVKKFIELEKYEEHVWRWNREKRQRDLRFMKLLFILAVILIVLLLYVNFLLT
jgi:hypothetical protein